MYSLKKPRLSSKDVEECRLDGAYGKNVSVVQNSIHILPC